MENNVSLSDVIDHIAPDELVIIHVDETQNLIINKHKSLFESIVRSTRPSVYSKEHCNFLSPIFTGTNALEIYKQFEVSSVRYIAISIPLLTAHDFELIIQTLLGSTVTLPPLFCDFMEIILGGHPRSFQTFLCAASHYCASFLESGATMQRTVSYGVTGRKKRTFLLNGFKAFLQQSANNKKDLFAIAYRTWEDAKMNGFTEAVNRLSNTGTDSCTSFKPLLRDYHYNNLLTS